MMMEAPMMTMVVTDDDNGDSYNDDADGVGETTATAITKTSKDDKIPMMMTALIMRMLMESREHC